MPQRYANAGDYEAARFLKMLALGISRYHPDPGRGYRGCAEVMKRVHVPSMEPSASRRITMRRYWPMWQYILDCWVMI
jgi:hypothetical protein